MIGDDDNIVAIATPPGQGGIGVVRVSGKAAPDIAHRMTGHTLKPRYAHFGDIRSPQGELIDQGITLLFRAPASFTGEDVVEFQVHGGPIVLDLIIEACLNQGCRMAQAGEFSKRAFLNNKLDLVQAEAIADLIGAGTRAVARQAMQSLQGVFSDRVKQLCDNLHHLRIQVEACMDFPDEDIELMQDEGIARHLTNINSQLKAIFQSAQSGVLIQEGLNAVIVGQPNAGKSSLMNALAGDERALVTDIEGTTRDIIRERIQINGLLLHLHDTAGLRLSTDKVEQLGIARARKAIAEADVMLIVLDATRWPSGTESNGLESLGLDQPLQAPTVIVRNKIDLSGELPSLNNQNDLDIVRLCARTGEGMDILKHWLQHHAGRQTHPEGLFSARRRHLDALANAGEHLALAMQLLNQEASGDLVAEELRLGQHALEHITGRIIPDNILGDIFSSFCIGK